MTKQTFRKQPRPEPSYPTLERFDSDRRAFIGSLGAGLLGVLTLAHDADPLGGKRKKPPRDKAKPKKKPPLKKKKPPLKKKPPPDHLDGDVLGAPARIDELD